VELDFSTRSCEVAEAYSRLTLKSILIIRNRGLKWEAPERGGGKVDKQLPAQLNEERL